MQYVNYQESFRTEQIIVLAFDWQLF